MACSVYLPLVESPIVLLTIMINNIIIMISVVEVFNFLEKNRWTVVD